MSNGRTAVRHGHDRFPVRPNDPRVPYHGIVAASLRHAMLPRGSRAVEWPHIAPMLDRYLDAPSPSMPPDDPLAAWVDTAVHQGVLSYAQSLAGAAAAVEAASHDEIQLRTELWSVREGHTSSVWRATLDADDGSQPITLCLNVARDTTVAARELTEIGTALERSHARDPDHFLPVIDEIVVTVATPRGPLTLPVLVSPWLEDARELHVVPDPEHSTGRWLAVDHFVSVPQSQQRMDGELLTLEASDDVWRATVALAVRIADLAGDELVVGPAIEPNEGDLVTADGHVIAISLSPPGGPERLGSWVLRQLLPSAGAAGLAWQRPDLAAVTFCQEVERNSNLPTVSTCLDAARREAQTLLAAHPAVDLDRALHSVLRACRQDPPSPPRAGTARSSCPTGPRRGSAVRRDP